jgi:ABC-type molybdate transport system substrate-binding protein
VWSHFLTETGDHPVLARGMLFRKNAQIPYSAGIAAKAKDAATARALVSFLRSGPALDVLKRKGMDLP